MIEIKALLERIAEKKKKLKTLRSEIYGVLKDNHQYQQLSEEFKLIKEKKKAFEHAEEQARPETFHEIELIKSDLKSDVELLSDLAFTKYMKGECVSVETEDGKTLEPKIKISYQASLF